MYQAIGLPASLHNETDVWRQILAKLIRDAFETK